MHLLFVNSKVLYFRSLQTMHLALNIPSHICSLFLTIPNKNEKTNKQQKQKEQVTKRFLNENNDLIKFFE